MIQDIGDRKLDNQYRNETPSMDDYVFVFQGNGRPTDSVLIKCVDGAVQIPKVKELTSKISLDGKLRYLFSIDDDKFFLYEDFRENVTDIFKEELIEDVTFEPVRTFRINNPGYLCFAGMTAYHLYVWYRDSMFCGRCGCETVHDDRFRMRKCPKCNAMFFPKIAPAVIVGVRNGDRLLMSRYAGREYKGRALLAGFCEIGETPEQTVVREVLEEVGIKVKNVTYYGCQPWGIDCNLLLGYYADVDGSEDITLDEEELASAGFVKREDIEKEDDHISLTSEMIEAFRTGRDK